MRKTISWVGAAILIYSTGWFLGWNSVRGRNSISTQLSPSDVWVTFSNVLGEPVPQSANGIVNTPGSWGIQAKRKLVINVYLVDDGIKTLKESLSVDPAIAGTIYATPLISENESRVLISEPFPVGTITGESTQISASIEFPKPYRIGCWHLASMIRGDEIKQAGEKLLFAFTILESEQPEKHLSGDVGVDEMVKRSSAEPISYVVLTCAEK